MYIKQYDYTYNLNNMVKFLIMEDWVIEIILWNNETIIFNKSDRWYRKVYDYLSILSCQ